jgi:hypothetical protein
LKASDFIKKRFLILFVLLIFISVVSCQNTSFGKNNFGEVDFKEGQKIQLVAGDEIYNLFVSFNENNDFSLKYLPESSEILLGTTVMVKGDQAEISCGELKFSKNMLRLVYSKAERPLHFLYHKTAKLKKVYQKTI